MGNNLWAQCVDLGRSHIEQANLFEGSVEGFVSLSISVFSLKISWGEAHCVSIFLKFS